MKADTKEKLLSAWVYCYENDKSYEFTVQFLMDSAQIERDPVTTFMENNKNFESMKYRVRENKRNLFKNK